MAKLENIRQDYALATLERKDVFENPIQQFDKWMKEAIAAAVEEPTVMTVCTVGADATPDARILLLKGVDDKGFRFYTNYDSPKGKDLATNNRISLVFFWQKLQRQVRIKGEAYRLTEQESTAYFQSRPKGSQIGAWASPQSQVIADRNNLEQKISDLEEEYKTAAALPKPAHWGGYVVRPYQIEFWQGRPSRLHDRICYTLEDLNPKKWKIERLAP